MKNVFWLPRNLDILSGNHEKRRAQRHASYTRDTLISVDTFRVRDMGAPSVLFENKM